MNTNNLKCILVIFFYVLLFNLHGTIYQSHEVKMININVHILRIRKKPKVQHFSPLIK